MDINNWLSEDIPEPDANPSVPDPVSSNNSKFDFILRLFRQIALFFGNIINTFFVSGLIIYFIFFIFEKISKQSVSGSTFLITYFIVVFFALFKTHRFILRAVSRSRLFNSMLLKIRNRKN
ncbi:MAG: hypothetical protein ACI4DU_10370 [Lachnospiraceae bacterium]